MMAWYIILGVYLFGVIISWIIMKDEHCDDWRDYLFKISFIMFWFMLYIFLILMFLGVMDLIGLALKRKTAQLIIDKHQFLIHEAVEVGIEGKDKEIDQLIKDLKIMNFTSDAWYPITFHFKTSLKNKVTIVTFKDNIIHLTMK